MPFPVSQSRIAESGLTAQNVERWEARESRHSQKVARLLWNGDQFYRLTQMSAAARLRLVAQFLADKVRTNLSIPVRKVRRRRVRDTTHFPHGGPIGSQYTYVPPESRSKNGEFPRADTTHLLKTVFMEGPEISDTTITCRVGQTLSYGVILETQMQRSFLVRTLNEEWPTLQQIALGGPQL